MRHISPSSQRPGGVRARTTATGRLFCGPLVQETPSSSCTDHCARSHVATLLRRKGAAASGFVDVVTAREVLRSAQPRQGRQSDLPGRTGPVMQKRMHSLQTPRSALHTKPSTSRAAPQVASTPEGLPTSSLSGVRGAWDGALGGDKCYASQATASMLHWERPPHLCCITAPRLWQLCCTGGRLCCTGSAMQCDHANLPGLLAHRLLDSDSQQWRRV